MNEHQLGWIPDTPDYRDFRLSAIEAVPAELPSSVDLGPDCAPPWDQGALGSCTGNGTAGLFRFVDRKQGGLNLNPSRLQIYYDARAVRGWQGSDTGAAIRDAISVVHGKGAVPEELWPYDISKFTQQPPASAYAKAEKSISYLRVDQNASAMQACLAAGFPFVIGFSVYENFFSVGADGIASMPSGKKVGGHCVLVVGYNQATGRWKSMNSWSEGWGNHGFFEIPFGYFTNNDLADDLWTIRQVQEQDVPQPPPPRPVPADVPVIGNVRYKKEIKLIVAGDFDPEAILVVDGRESEAGVHDGRFVTRQHLEPGAHSVVVTNPNGKFATKDFEV